MPYVAWIGIQTQPRRTGSSHGGGETSSLLESVDSSVPKGLWIVSDHLPRRWVTPVGERSDSRSLDVVDEVEHDGIGVAGGVGDAEVEIQGEPSLIACVQLAQRRAALEDQCVKAASFVQNRAGSSPGQC